MERDLDRKFYVPSIDEFHPGFEFEYFYRKEWNKHNLDGSPIVHHGLDEFDDDLMKIAHAICRVKHLDREDIESLGWGDYKHSVMDWWSIKGNFRTPGDRHEITEYKLRYDIKAHELHIECYFWGESEGMLFEGFIKNKSELKTLMEWLNIV